MIWKSKSKDNTQYATFAGSGAYYPSLTQTYAHVDQTMEPSPTEIPVQLTSIADTYFIPVVVAIILQ